MLFNIPTTPNETTPNETTPNETPPNEHYQTKQNASKSKNDKIFKKMTKKKKNAFML